MKISGKKIIAGVAAMAVSCSAMCCFATEGETSASTAPSVVITSVSVLDSADATPAQTYTTDLSNVSLSVSQMLQVKAKIVANGADQAGEISFLSNIDGTEVANLSNDTIQYVDQKTASTDNPEVTVTFRPRATIGSNSNGLGTFVAKLGGTDVQSATSFNYTVVDDKSTMTFTADTATTISEGGTVTFIAKGENDALLSGATVTATKDGDTQTSVTGTTGEDGKCTLTFANKGTYTVKATKDKYYDSTAITVKVNKQLTEEDNTKIDDAVENITVTETKATETTNAELTLPETVTPDTSIGSVAPDYKLNGNKYDQKVTIEDNKITVDKSLFAAKINVTVTIEGKDVNKTIYYVKDTEKEDNIAFGNLALAVTADGGDAFDQSASSEELTAAKQNTLEEKALALSYALNSTDMTSNPIKSAIDYDLNGTVTLSEYYMFKELLNNNEAFTPAKFAEARQNWINQAKNNTAE